jgi:xylan 1,4-beta-xylosidase
LPEQEHVLKKICPLLSLSVLAACLVSPCHGQQAVQLEVHVDRNSGPWKPVWAYVGHDEANYTYSPEGRELLVQLANISPEFEDRAHNLLTTGEGTPALKWGSTNAYTEDAQGNPIYNWTILDRIFDIYKQLGITPYVEIGFMPEALSTNPQPYRHHWPHGPLFTGWTYPPNDYHKWSELIYRWVQHDVDRYGRKTVGGWDWEVWNEPDIGYWHGTREEYFKLYDYTAAAVKRALPEAHVGGPATTGPAGAHAAEFLRAFLTHCLSGKNYATGKTGAPLDFISFHAKGRTRVVDGRAQMDISHSLRDISAGFEIVAGFPALRRLPIVISESDPEGCAACAASVHPENEYRNTPQYASYEAELLDGTMALAARYGVNLQGSITWAFTFPGHPYFYGYRSLATHQIDKPILNAFGMFGLMESQRVAAESSAQLSMDDLLKSGARVQSDVRVVATRGDEGLSVLVWNYDDDAVAEQPAQISMHVEGLPASLSHVRVTHYRIDESHSDAYTAWKRMGSPQQPSAVQTAKLKAAGRLQSFRTPAWTKVHAGEANLSFSLPRQALSLIRLDWAVARK